MLASCGATATDPQPPLTGDNTPPTVTSVSPTNQASDVSLNTTISATFSEAITTASATAASFTLISDGGALVAGVVGASGNTATFAPSVSLASNTRYTATISSGVRDTAGNGLISSYSWSFTTGAVPDVTAPTVTGTSPQNGATGVAFNTVISVTFSESMTNSSLTPASFIVAANGASAIPGVVNVTGTTATFKPTADLAPGTLYTVTITNAARDASGNPLAGTFVLTFTTGATPDTSAPTVTSNSPASGGTGVVRSTNVTATFSEPMSEATITTASFTLTPTAGGSAIPGTVDVAGAVATFIPAATLAASTQYTASLSTAVTDASGNPLAASYSWSFTTAAAPDVTPPTVIANTPLNGATAVGLNTAISATFSEPLTNSTITAASMSLSPVAGGPAIGGSVSVTGNTATFVPGANLAGSTQFRATITTAVKDAAGNGLAANFSWTFTTGAAPDVTPPTVTSTTPASGAIAVSRSEPVLVTFSEPMTTSTLNTTTFTLVPTAGGAAVAGTVTMTGNTASFAPSAQLAGLTRYTATVTTAAKDAAGNALAANYSWTFTTAVVPDLIPPIIIANAPANNATGVALNVAPTVTFSEPMQNTTLNASTFTLAPTSGGPAVAGTVTVNGNAATFTPAASLAGSTQYTATITTGAKDAAGNALVTNASWRFTTAAPADVTPPTVSSFTPTDGATGVTTTIAPTVTFSEPMQNATITTTTFTLAPSAGGAGVSGVVTVSGNTATFTPSAPLAAGTPYRATITTGVRDAAGNALAANATWTFTTAVPVDVTPPTVTATSPLSSATGVSVASPVSATFSEPMQNATITASTFTLAPTNGGAAITGVVTVSGSTATFTPSAALNASTQYTATVTSGVRDAAGNALAASYVWTFTTAAPADVTPPTVTSTTPAGGATGVSTNAVITATFSEPMQNSTITSTSFTLTRVQGLAPVSGTVSVTGNVARFTPNSSLMNGRVYSAVITTAVKDAAGNALTSSFTWTFTTVP